jgi:hypothetical protein
MPKAPIHEDGYLCRPEDDIHSAPGARNNGLLETVSESTAMEFSPKCQLRCGIAHRLALHPAPRTGRCREGIRGRVWRVQSHASIICRHRCLPSSTEPIPEYVTRRGLVSDPSWRFEQDRFESQCRERRPRQGLLRIRARPSLVGLGCSRGRIGWTNSLSRQ